MLTIFSSPNHKRDDDVMYGDGSNNQGEIDGSNPLTGRNTSSTDAQHTSTDGITGHNVPTSATSAYNSNSNVTDTSRQSHQVNEANKTSLGSASTNDRNVRPGETSFDDAATVSSIKSGVIGNKPSSGVPEPTSGSTSAVRANAASSNPLSSTAHSQQYANNPTSTESTYYTDPAAHEHGGLGHTYRGDPCETESVPDGEPAGYPHHVGGPHHVETANRIDPHVPGEYPSEDGRDRHSSHLGRNAAVGGGGAAAAGIAAGEAWRQNQSQTSQTAGHTSSAHASKPSSTSPHSSAIMNKLDPRVDSDANRTSTTNYTSESLPRQTGGTDAAGATTASTTSPHSSAILNKLDPRVDSNADRSTVGNQSSDPHHGRNAALGVASAGALGAGAYEANRSHQTTAAGTGVSQATPGTTAGFGHQPTEPFGQTHGHREQAVIGGAQLDGTAMGQQGSHDAILRGLDDQRAELPHRERTHEGRDAAIGTAGAGAVGAGAYGIHKHNQHDRAGVESNTVPTQNNATLNKLDPQTRDNETSYAQRQSEPLHHNNRDAAVVGGSAAAAGAGAGVFAASQHSDKELEKQLADRQKEQDRQLKEQLKEHDRELAKDTKAAMKTQHQAEKDHDAQRRHDAKVLEKQAVAEDKQHKHDIAAAEKAQHKEEKHAEKKHEAEVAALEKKHQHDAANAEKSREHEQAAVAKAMEADAAHAAKVREHMEKVDHKEAEKAEKDKKPGLLDRILHRDKHDKDTHHETEPTGASSPTNRTGSVDADSLYGNDGKLHKEPPQKVKERIEAQLAHGERGPGETGSGLPTTAGFGRDATIEGADSTDPTTGLEGTRAPRAAH